MIDRLRDHIDKHFPQLWKGTYLMTVSGGVDSVVLTHLLDQLKIDFQVAHCNFHLRSVESDGDQQFVEQLASQLDKSCHVKHFETHLEAEKQKVSTQMVARSLRYNWFNDLVDSHDLAGIITAHHLDDQMETFFINLNRGTGIDGLTGIPAVSGQVLRPLLPFTRKEIEQCARDNQWSWREDSSNSNNHYMRNELRNKVLPAICGVLPHFKANFPKTLSHLEDVKTIVEEGVSRFRESVTTTTDTSIIIDIKKLKEQPSYRSYLFYLLKPYGFTDLEAVEQLLQAQTGKYIMSPEYMLLKDRQKLSIGALENTGIDTFEIERSTRSITTPVGQMTIERISSENPLEFVSQNRDIMTLLLDASSIKYPLTLRRWEAGDRISPYGLDGSQLVSDILTNKKLSLFDKNRTLVVATENNIIWVVGHRASKHHLITTNTKEIVKITWS